MSTYTPTPKVATVGLTGTLSTVILWVLGQCHITMPPEVAVAFSTLLMVGASYLAPHSAPTPEQIKQILDQQQNPPP